MATYVSKFTGAQIDQRLELAGQIPDKANKNELPTKVSDLNNDSEFISKSDKITGGGKSKTVAEILLQTVDNETSIAAEKQRAEGAEGALGAAVTTERERAQGAEAAIGERISALESSKFKVVETLPATGETNVIYLVPSKKPGESNIKNEFIWVGGKWEQLGSYEGISEPMSEADWDKLTKGGTDASRLTPNTFYAIFE